MAEWTAIRTSTLKVRALLLICLIGSAVVVLAPANAQMVRCEDASGNRVYREASDCPTAQTVPCEDESGRRIYRDCCVYKPVMTDADQRACRAGEQAEPRNNILQRKERIVLPPAQIQVSPHQPPPVLPAARPLAATPRDEVEIDPGSAREVLLNPQAADVIPAQQPTVSQHDSVLNSAAMGAVSGAVLGAILGLFIGVRAFIRKVKAPKESAPTLTAATGATSNATLPHSGMKWLAYIAWFVVWFFVHSFFFVPAIKASDDAIVTSILAAVNVLVLAIGFYFVSKQFSKQAESPLTVTAKPTNDRQNSSPVRDMRRSNNEVTMNEKQKKIVIGAICVIVAMLLYPPFLFHGPNAITRNLGYSFLFDPPRIVYPDGVQGTVDIAMLLVQWLAVAVVAAVLWWLSKDKG